MSDTKRKAFLVFLIIEILALVIFVKENFFSVGAITEIKRPTADQPETYKTLTLETEEGKEDVSLNIKPKEYTDDEIRNLIEKAKKEIEKSVFSNNDDGNNITEDLVIKSSYADGKVKASWDFDNVEIVDATGKINLSNIKEPSLVNALCTLKIGEYEEVYSFGMRVLPPDSSTEKGFRFFLNEAIEKENEKTNTGTFILPRTLNGISLSWKEKEENTYVLLFVFGIVAALAALFGENEDKKKKEKERQRMLEEDYPDIVSALSLYIGAGITIKGAIQRIGESYKKNNFDDKNRRPGYEGLLQLLRQMSDGAGELESLKAFGRRIGNKNYRKLALLLAQNLRKGSATIAESLEKEEQSAFEERKLRAKIAGEEASTKLLLPMMGLLGIVVVVLVFPAFIGMGM